MLYLDTSLLVAAFTDEPGSARVDSLLRKPDECMISEWVIAEFSAALSIKVRTGQISDAHRDHALVLFSRMTAESLGLLPVQSHHFRRAAQLSDQYRPGLRAGDALHLAVAGDKGVTLCTFDRRQARAGKALGIATRVI